MRSPDQNMSTLKVSDWLKRATKVVNYKTDNSKDTSYTNCRECGTPIKAQERRGTLSIISLIPDPVEKTEFEDQHVFYDICDKCYPILENQITDKMV